jgi:hypothetical protein
LRRPFACLLFCPAMLRQSPLLPLLDERLVAAGIRRCRTPLEVQHVIDYCREEGAIVAHQYDRTIQLSQIALEPLGRFEVQMVRGLIEQEDVGRCHELTREPDAPAFPSTQLRQRLTPGDGRIEPESLEHGIDARSDRIAALALEPFQVAPVSRQCCPVARFRHGMGLLGERLLEREKLGEGARRRFPDGRGVSEIPVLAKQGER